MVKRRALEVEFDRFGTQHVAGVCNDFNRIDGANAEPGQSHHLGLSRCM